MAPIYPTGFIPITWAHVQSAQITSVYILEDGRIKPYGPYTVLDPINHEVRDDHGGTFGPVNFFVGVSEVIGIPDPNAALKAPPVQTVGVATTGTAMNVAVAGQIYDELYDAITTQIASKSSQLDPATRIKLENEARIKRDTVIRRLAQALKP